MPTPIRKLQRLADALQGRAPRSEADEAWLAAALEQYLKGEEISAALGLVIEAGDRDPRTILRQTKRDDLLRKLAAEICPDECVSRQADIVSAALHRYFTTAWARDRTRTSPPDRNAKLWAILTLHAAPLGSRRVRFVLGAR